MERRTKHQARRTFFPSHLEPRTSSVLWALRDDSFEVKHGDILGMTKAEIDQKFDEIVDFADVERLLDTPVKRYSGGMHVRLGFAVAAHHR